MAGRRLLFHHKIVLREPAASASGGGATSDVERLTAWRQLNATNTTTFTAVGMPAVATTAAGGVATAHDSTGRWVNYNSGTALNADAGWTVQATLVDTNFQFKPEVSFSIKTGAVAADIANVRIWVGMFSGNPMASDTAGTGAGGNVFAFRYSTSASDANWKTYTEDGADNNTVKDSGVLVAANTLYKLRIKCVSSALIEFYVNDTLVQSHVTADDLPGAAVGVGTICAARNLSAGTARSIKIGRMTMTEATIV